LTEIEKYFNKHSGASKHLFAANPTKRESALRQAAFTGGCLA
jgi:hypothetical protein